MTTRVPIALYSAALDEIYLLRAACAYEAMANRATAEMTVPKAVSRALDEINTLLVDAARGRARSLQIKKKVSFGRSGWEAQRGLRNLVEADPRRLVDETLYLTALAEIHALGTVLAAAARKMPDLLLFKTFPASRRPVVTAQTQRMRTAAGGGVQRYYDHTSSAVLKRALTEAGARDGLTRTQFEAEQADPTDGATR